NQHTALAVRQQNLSGVNIGLRNGLAQLQIDLAGAGQNLLATDKTAPSFDLGVIIRNNVPGKAATCTPDTSTWAYPVSSACFDSFTIVNLNACATGAGGGTTAPVLVIDDAGSEDLSANGTTYANDPNFSENAGSLTSDASCFKAGDELLYIEIPQGGTTAPQCGDNTTMFYCLAVTTLTADAKETTATGVPTLNLTHNLVGTGGAVAGCPGSSCTDALGIIGASNFEHALLANFPSATTYIVDLGKGSNDVTYAVLANAANASDPQLLRCGGAVCTAASGQVVTDQVIGFKIGAALWDNDPDDATDIANYFYDGTKYCSNAINGADCTVSPPPKNDPYDFTLVRSVRISMVARTTPQTDQTLRSFANGFDQGPYLVQQGSVVVDLRNMSIPDFAN
ncbi:MAG: hypothetical protein ACRD40_13060, partial [Candidatus Acidiferrales bacterium]